MTDTKKCEGCSKLCKRRKSEGQWDWAKRKYCGVKCFRKNLAKRTYHK